MLAFYALVAPGAGQSTFTGVLFAFLLGQLFLLARVAMRVAQLGGASALFQALGAPAGESSSVSRGR